MREIEFRGKRIDNGEWVYGSLIVEKSSSMCLQSYGISVMEEYYMHTIITKENTYQKIRIKKETLGQYTGLKDDTGKKIYEGDILKYCEVGYVEDDKEEEYYKREDLDWTITKIIWGGSSYPAFDLNEHDFEYNGLHVLSDFGEYYCEVIGNIHDNKEND